MKPNQMVTYVAMLAFTGFGTSAAQAAGASANGRASVLQGTTLASLLEMDFGTIATNGLGGTVNLDASNSSRTCGSGMVCSGSFAFATLRVTGAATNVQVNFDPVVQLTGPGAPMNAAILFPGGQGAVITLVNGQATVYFGANLGVNANQGPGVYQGTFNVNVNYQ
jgi:Domain of unknown function (DUF4402)